jgi:hypothetical protein
VRTAPLASTSAGFAWSSGHADGANSRDEVLAHLRTLCAATDLPVNADFESGYAATADGVHESVRLAAPGIHTREQIECVLPEHGRSRGRSGAEGTGSGRRWSNFRKWLAATGSFSL